MFFIVGSLTLAAMPSPCQIKILALVLSYLSLTSRVESVKIKTSGASFQLCSFSSDFQVRPDTTCPTARAPSTLVALQGESEAIQFVLRPDQDLPKVRASLENVPRGVECQIHQVGFVWAMHNRRVEGSGGGWFPDPLLPLSAASSFDIPSSTSQPIWISCAVSNAASPGVTNMQFTLHSRDKLLSSSHLELNVLPILLPTIAESKIGTAWSGNWEENNFLPYYGDRAAAVAPVFMNVMTRHRMPPDSIYLPQPKPLSQYVKLAEAGVQWFALVDVSNYKDQTGPASLLQMSEAPEGSAHNANSWGRQFHEVDTFPAASLLQVTQTSSATCPESFSDAGIERLIEALRSTVSGLEEKGLLDRAYVYGFDEKGPECEPEIRKVFGAVKAAFPKLKTHAVLNWALPLDLPLDIQTIAYEKFMPLEAEKWVKAGKLQWHYHCIEPHESKYLNSFIERPALHARLLFWLAALREMKYGAPSGWLYWAMDYWRPCDSEKCGQFTQPKVLERTARNSMNRTAFTDFPPASYIWKPEIYDIFANGDGMFLYPCQDGPCESLRLDALQNGLEDWEMFRMLGPELGMRLIEQVVQGPTQFEEDAAKVEAVRREALYLLVQKQR